MVIRRCGNSNRAQISAHAVARFPHGRSGQPDDLGVRQPAGQEYLDAHGGGFYTGAGTAVHQREAHAVVSGVCGMPNTMAAHG